MGRETVRPSVLIGMLHVGEPSVPRVRDLIRAQQDVDVELLEIAHLPEREAHARLYAAFDTADPRHDALVKVDADMELVEPRLLHAIAVLLRDNPPLDHVVVGVDDWFSGERILGLSSWRNGVRWTSPPPELFTDLPTSTARTKLKAIDIGRTLVVHAADPTDVQAARYGLHRGLKAVATGKASRIARLVDVVDHAATSPARGRLLAVAAIGLALTDAPVARDLLDATKDPDADLGVLTGRLEEPGLCAAVRGRIEVLAAASGDDDVAAPAPGRPLRQLLRRVVGTVRRVSARAGGRHAPSEEELRAAWRAELVALLDGAQPSRSRA